LVASPRTAAKQLATRLDIGQRIGRSEPRKRAGSCQRTEEQGFFHAYLFLMIRLVSGGFFIPAKPDAKRTDRFLQYRGVWAEAL